MTTFAVLSKSKRFHCDFMCPPHYGHDPTGYPAPHQSARGRGHRQVRRVETEMPVGPLRRTGSHPGLFLLPTQQTRFPALRLLQVAHPNEKDRVPQIDTVLVRPERRESPDAILHPITP